MRKGVLVAVIVLTSILLGSLAAGTPVAGNGSVAAVTAGIELGTAPVARAAASATVEGLGALRSLVTSVQVLLILVAGLVVRRGFGGVDPTTDRGVDLARAHTRRGPPARP